MPYDYFEILKKINEKEEYKETTDVVRETLWRDTIDFEIMQEWQRIEEKLSCELYIYLRYS